MKKLGLYILIIAPYALMIYLFVGFIEHYHYLTTIYFKTMENTYFMGCMDSACMDFHICHERGERLSSDLQKGLNVIQIR